MATGTQLEKSPLAAPGKVAPGGRVQGFLGLLQVRWAEMAAAQRGWVVLGLLMTLGTIGGLTWYATRTDWRTLYVHLDGDEAREMGEMLAQAQIPYEPTADGGGLRVPAEQLDKARLLTAAKG